MVVAIPFVLPRAVMVWGLTRLLLAALPLGVGDPFGSLMISPILVVPFMGLVGAIDVHVRRERILWENLAIRPAALYLVYAAAAAAGEYLLSVLR